jgi:hypothetical protein
MLVHNVIPRKIRMSDISFSDASFKISRNSVGDELRSSVIEFGLIEPPVIRGGDGVIIFGHNRLRVLSDNGAESVEAVVTDDIQGMEFVRMAILKHYRNEIGPIGRLKLARILSEKFRMEPADVNRLARNTFNVPDEFASGGGLMEKALGLPETLSAYIDAKDIGYKIIKTILKMDPESIGLMDSWIEAANIRINFFRDMADFIYDIRARDGNTSRLKSIDPGSVEDKKQRELYIYNELRKARYPEYTAMKGKADRIIADFKRGGVDIDFPEYFEGDSLGLRITLSRRNIGGLRDLMKSLDIEGIQSLIDML